MICVAVLGIVFECVIVLAEQILAIVIAVWCPDNRMNVAARRFTSWSFKRNRPLVIEFDENDRAMNSIVENRVRIHLAYPCKIGLVQMNTHFVQLDGSLAVVDVAYI